MNHLTLTCNIYVVFDMSSYVKNLLVALSEPNSTAPLIYTREVFTLLSC